MPGRRPRAAIVQAGALTFDRHASTQKAIGLITHAAEQGADLILLPEAFIPGYPRGLDFGMRVGIRTQAGRELWKLLWDQSVAVPSPTTEALAKASREAGAVTAVGVIERDERLGRGTLYCTLLVFGPDGALIHSHRKIKPTGSERLIWGEGDGSSLRVVDTPAGRIGGLICWENYMPLARMALYGQGLEVLLAPTADARDSWLATMRHIACEGRCFVLGSNQFVTTNMLTPELATSVRLETSGDVLCRGGSIAVTPMGEVIAGPVYDREETLFVDLDLDDVVRGKLDLDVAGHYSRPDLLELVVHQRPMASLKFLEP